MVKFETMWKNLHRPLIGLNVAAWSVCAYYMVKINIHDYKAKNECDVSTNKDVDMVHGLVKK